MARGPCFDRLSRRASAAAPFPLTSFYMQLVPSHAFVSAQVLCHPSWIHRTQYVHRYSPGP